MIYLCSHESKKELRIKPLMFMKWFKFDQGYSSERTHFKI